MFKSKKTLKKAVLQETTETNSNSSKFKHKKKALLVALELLIVVLFLLALGSPLNTKLVNLLLLHPTKELVVRNDVINTYKEKYGVTLEDFRFPSKNGKLLHAWYLKNPKSKFTYLVSHGNAGNLSFLYAMFSVLLEAGGSIFIYDYQGFGLSDGESNDKSIIDDGISSYDFLVKKLKLKPENIILYGESLGCAVTTKIMEARPVAAVILQSPFATLVQTAKDKIHWTIVYPDSLFPQRHLENISAYKSKHPPLLLIHGETDWILSSRYSKEIYDAAIEPKQLLLIPNLGHNNLYTETDNKAAISTIKQFANSI